MRHVLQIMTIACAVGAAISPVQAQTSITPDATTAGDNADVTQDNSITSTTTTQDQTVTHTTTNTVAGDQINNTYISGSSSGTAENSSIRPSGARDPLRSSSRGDGENDRGRDSQDAYRRDVLRAATPSQQADLVDNQITSEQDAIRADRLLESAARGTLNAQSINNRAPDTGRIPLPVTGPAAQVQFAPQPAPSPIVVVPPVGSR